MKLLEKLRNWGKKQPEPVFKCCKQQWGSKCHDITSLHIPKAPFRNKPAAPVHEKASLDSALTHKRVFLEPTKPQAFQRDWKLPKNGVLICSRVLAASQSQPFFKDTISHLCQDCCGTKAHHRNLFQCSCQFGESTEDSRGHTTHLCDQKEGGVSNDFPNSSANRFTGSNIICS